MTKHESIMKPTEKATGKAAVVLQTDHDDNSRPLRDEELVVVSGGLGQTSDSPDLGLVGGTTTLKKF